MPIPNLNAADKLAHIALAEAGVLIAQPSAGCSGKALDVALGEQVARDLAVLFQRGDHAHHFIPLRFNLRHRAAEHIGVAVVRPGVICLSGMGLTPPATTGSIAGPGLGCG